MHWPHGSSKKTNAPKSKLDRAGMHAMQTTKGGDDDLRRPSGILHVHVSLSFFLRLSNDYIYAEEGTKQQKMIIIIFIFV